MNMVSLAVPDADVEETGLRLALRQAAPVFEAALAAEVLGAASAEGREGFDAFAERRAPQW
jgi:hypothetical protein